MQADRREIARYLGYRGVQPDANVEALIESCLDELDKVVTPRSVWREFPLKFDQQNESIDLGFVNTQSHSLYRNLQGCESVVLFAATLGSAVDTLIHRYSITEITRSVVMQAAAAALIEAYCDDLQEAIRLQMLERGLYLRPRFSPGYGDLPLALQRDIIPVLKTAKEIGLTLTDNLLMVPMKSVTAFIGLSRQEIACHKQGCELCDKTDCQFRRES